MVKAGSPVPTRASIILAVSEGGDGLLTRLQSLHHNVSSRHSFELIVVLSDKLASTGDALRRAFENLTLLETQVPLGVPAACNLAARSARGEYLVILDEHAETEPGWLDWLIYTAAANPQAGAVGGCVLFPDGRLREAGSVVWWDGRVTGIGRGTLGAALPWRFVRRVDCASGCSLLVRRAVWTQLGGFDEIYAPGAYHDVDLCLRVRSLGQQVLFEPRSRVKVSESPATSDGFAGFSSERLRLVLLARWKRELQAHGPSSSGAVHQAIHRARGYPRRVLVVDDFIPDPAAGAGFGRMFDTIIELAQAGYAIAHYPTRGASAPADPLIDCGMSIIEGDLCAHLQCPDTWYDVLIVSRPHNFEYAWPAVRVHQPWAALVYDCEALWWRRLERQAALTSDLGASAQLLDDAARMQQIEIRNIHASDVVVTVSNDERDLVLAAGVAEQNVFTQIPVERGVSLTSRGFHTRRDIGFVAGWMGGAGSPNADGLRWFLERVRPAVLSRIPWVRLRVTGRNPPAELRALSDPNLTFEGHVEDLSSFYDRIRVVISPIRFGAGVKLKTIQAIQHGVPTVATCVGAEGLTVASAGGLYVSDEPLSFASMVIRLLTDEHEWQQSRDALITCVDTWATATPTESWSGLVNKLCARRIDASGAKTTQR